MLKASYPEIQLAAINDELSDEQWSEKLDQIIVKRFPDADVTLYGSRDSFLAVYTGRFPTVHIPPVSAPSGTDIRKKLFAKKRRK